MEAFMQIILSHLTQISPWIISLLFFISAILQITFPPYPGDTLLIFGGYLGSFKNTGGSIAILLSYLIGTLLSSYALYVLGAWKGKAVLRLKFVSKYFTTNHQRRARRWLLKYGIFIFFICKFVPGLNSLIIIFGGIFRFNPLLACFGVGFASIIHNILFFLVGRSIGYNVGNIKHFLSTYNIVVAAVIFTGLLSYLGYKRLMGDSDKKNAERE